MTDDVRVVLCTCPDTDEARRLATSIVESGAGACVNIVPGLTSVYRWKGEVLSDPEVLLIVKCHAGQLADLVALIEREHSYDVPECIALPVVGGMPDYLEWVASGGE